MNAIIQDGMNEILGSIYTSLGFSLCLAILFMFAYAYVKENGLKSAMEMWVGQFKAEAFLNMVMLMPLIFLIYLFHGEKIFDARKLSNILFHSCKLSFLTSITIEFLQLMFRLGTVQIADIVYITLGGVVGGIKEVRNRH